MIILTEHYLYNTKIKNYAKKQHFHQSTRNTTLFKRC